MASIDTLLKRSRGIAPGVPTLRHGLALAILFTSAIEVNARFAALQRSPLGIILLAGPTMLLAVTGFLLARSAEKRSVQDFAVQASAAHRREAESRPPVERTSPEQTGGGLMLRYARRLLPPLAISLVITIAALGLFVSTAGLRRYFGAAETWSYLGNIIGWSNDTLPGIFEFNNASSIVNAPLWMVPVVLLGCLLAALAARVPTALRGLLYAAALVGVVGLAFVVDGGVIDQYALPRALRPLVDPGVIAGAAGLVLGMIAQRFRRRVAVRGMLILLAIAVIAGAALLPRFSVDRALLETVLALPLAYLAVVLAITPLPTPWPVDRVNYALGIILYAYPVVQTCIAVFGPDQSLLVTVLIGLPATVFLAAASWHLVERPLLARFRDEPVLTRAGPAPLFVIRPARWYVARVQRALPAAGMVVAFAAVMLALMAVAMVALQRDQPGM